MAPITRVTSAVGSQIWTDLDDGPLATMSEGIRAVILELIGLIGRGVLPFPALQ